MHNIECSECILHALQNGVILIAVEDNRLNTKASDTIRDNVFQRAIMALRGLVCKSGDRHFSAFKAKIDLSIYPSLHHN